MELIAHAFISDCLGGLGQHSLAYQFVLDLSDLLIHQDYEATVLSHFKRQERYLDNILCSFFEP